MLDEPSLGLSPSVVKDVFQKIEAVNHKNGVSLLIVEQKVREVLAICDRVYSLKLGKVAFAGTPAELTADPTTLRDLFL